VAVRVAAIYAHPDDDTYSLAGALALEGRERIDYTLILATSGEAGPISDPSLATREQLAQVREGEQRAALDAVGFGDATVHFLRYPDGGVKDVPRDELVDAIAEILRTIRPHIVVTFGPEGVTKHDDHVAVSQAATEAFHRAQADAADADTFQRLYYNALARSSLESMWERLRSRGVEMGDPERPFMPRGVPDETIAVRVDARTVVKRKLEAIRAHRTQQVELEYLPQDLQPEVLGVECFVQAWPPTEEAVERPAMTGLLEGLDG
jgi:LmbE family N-acetylglucosaminyl deacetylase